MGIFRLINNRKRTEKQKKPRKAKRQAKAARKAARGPIPVNIEDVELYSTEMLKNKLQNPRNNIKLSGRNRKRQLKRLKNELRDEQRKAGQEQKKKDFVNDLFMEDAEDTKETETTADNTEMKEQVPSSSQPSSSSTETATKKKKRGGRKKNKGKGKSEGVGDDVEMEEL